MSEFTKANSKGIATLEGLIAQTGNTCAFDGPSSIQCITTLFAIINEMGLDPMKTADLRKGIFDIFNVELVNMPNLADSRFILAPNHVSDFDAIILGLLHPTIRIVSKKAWTDNAKLRQFLDLHYDLYGLDRTSLASLRSLLNDAIHYFNDNAENKHYLVFSQGTISDFNNNSPQRVSTVAKKIADKTGVPIVTLFVEQVSLHHPTRIVFDTPIKPDKQEDFRTLWLEREAALQNALVPPARRPKLTQKHANNNKPGDPFF